MIGRIAVIPNIPRFDTVNVAPESSSGVTVPARTRSASRFASRVSDPSERVSAIGLGGWHLSLAHVDADVAERIRRAATRIWCTPSEFPASTAASLPTSCARQPRPIFCSAASTGMSRSRLSGSA